MVVVILLLAIVYFLQNVPELDGLFFRRNSVLVYKEVRVHGHPDYVRQEHASMSNTDGVAKVSLAFNQTVTLEAPILWRISIMHLENDVFVRSFMNADIEICSFFRTVSVNPFFKQIYTNARQFGKIPSRCPIKRDTYFVKDFIFDVNILPEILPSNRFRFEFDIRKVVERGVYEYVLNFSTQFYFIKNKPH